MDLKGIGDNAFINDSTIISVKFGDRCISVGENAFKGCVSLSEINDDNVIETIGSNAFEGAALSSVTFNKLSDLHQYAFKDCSDLEYINIPNCNTIRNGAFQSCESLSDVDIKNVLSIGEDAFDKCTSLSNVDIPNCGDIGKNAFKGCSNLTHVNNGIVTVGDSAFHNCSNLKDIYLDRCVDIKNGAFENCINLEKANLSQCTNIGESAFKGCTNITQVSLSICKKIDVLAFANCSKLNRVYIYNQPDTFCKLGGNYVFCEHDGDNCSINNNITFFFRPDAIESYKKDEYWSHYIDNMIMMVDEKQIVYTTNNNSIIEVDETIADQIVKNEYYTNYGLIEFKDKITSLNQKIFKGSTTLTSIDIPSGCESIGENEFEGCVNLNNITLSNTLNRIDDYAFKNCESLTSFTIPQSVTTLGEGIFAGCKNIERFEGNFVAYDGKAIIYNNKLICVLPKDDGITEGRIHKLSKISYSYSNIQHLGKSCFSGCVNMRRFDIDSNIEYIGDNAFEGCTNLCEIHFHWGVPPELGQNVFNFANVREDLKIFVPEARFEYYNNVWSTVTESDEKEYLFNNIYPSAGSNSIIYYTNSTESNPSVNLSCPNGKYFKIPYTNDTLSAVFTGRPEVTKVILGENITKIGQNAFRNCKNLEYVYLYDNITQLHNSCFYGCENLTRIHISNGIKTASNSVGSDVFYGCTKLKEFGTYYKNRVSADGRCYIDSTNRLTFFAQGELTNGETYSIPNYVSEIHKTAFRGSIVENIKLTMSTRVIGDYAFSECLNLKSIENWDNVETISSYAFNGCSDLGKISLPSKLKTISTHAFDGCELMYTDKNIPDSVTVIGSYAFNDCFNFKYIDNIKQEEVALNLGNISYINELSFHNCSSLTKVNINDKIDRIGFKSFANCSKLRSVYISNNSMLSQIENEAFYNCPELEELYLPENLHYIGSSSFQYCENYKGGTYMLLDNNEKEYSLLLPYDINSLGTSCFKNSGIEKLIITKQSGLGSIPNGAFQGCKNLKIVNMSDATNIQSIGSNAFEGCSNLCKDISVGGKLKLPTGIRTIKDEAFKGCENILSATLPRYLKSLGDFCFATGNSQTDIYIPVELRTPPKFTKGDIETTESNPFGDISATPTKIPEILVHSSYVYTYKTNEYWKKYINRITSIVTKECLEDYISSIVCDTNGFSSVIGSDWSANVIFDSNIPLMWAGTTVYFNVYDETDRILPHPGGTNYQWSFTLTNNLVTGGMPQIVVIITGGYSSLGGTETNPAKYIKITGVSNTIVKYSGEDIGVSNY